ncbi:hypothetical protein [Aquicoccus porphyridii]|uniref:Uncharacterized protein n=1 Tax=Aquicoccus porphyridii TaxID=1852029 RepID=A0A5A9Z535_9RHOB|nr:hypothetical protein [Aquicoccus porphyridii]KAA0912085.1 hypothetical protein FLO80_16895 [Aquicoccus porphyridii]RAI53059.1 hypothetical protein DOO74_14320 [Rhodobacteraceae bacterium AsT-22]
MTGNGTQDNPEVDDNGDDTALVKKILLALVVILAAWGAAIFKWGVPGLYIPALASVPLIYLVLIIVARG